MNMEKLSKPEITAKEEKAVLFQLIKRSDLVRQLIIEMNVKEIVGKSKIFKVLSEAFSNNIGKKSEKPVEERKRKLPDGGREPKKTKEKFRRSPRKTRRTPSQSLALARQMRRRRVPQAVEREVRP